MGSEMCIRDSKNSVFTTAATQGKICLAPSKLNPRLQQPKWQVALSACEVVQNEKMKISCESIVVI